MKIVVFILLAFSVALAAPHTRVISKITDTYQVRSGTTKLLESDYEVGTFNEVDGMATDIQTLTEQTKGKTNTVEHKLAQVLKMSGSDSASVSSKKISEEVCTTSIELTF